MDSLTVNKVENGFVVKIVSPTRKPGESYYSGYEVLREFVAESVGSLEKLVRQWVEGEIGERLLEEGPKN